MGTGRSRIVGNWCIGHTRYGAVRLDSGKVSQNPSQGGAWGSALSRVSPGLLGQNKWPWAQEVGEVKGIQDITDTSSSFLWEGATV